MAVRERILAAVPGAALASDQLYREADLAIDFCEDVPPLPRAKASTASCAVRRGGATAKVSSIHVNGWFGSYDKLGMTRIMLRGASPSILTREREKFVFAGDSPNDAADVRILSQRGGRRQHRRLRRPHVSALPAYVTRAAAAAASSNWRTR